MGPHPEVCREVWEPLPDKAGESTLLSPSGGDYDNDDNFKKIRDTKGTFHAKGSIRDRNIMDLTEAADFKKRGQE